MKSARVSLPASLDFFTLRRLYESRELRPADLIRAIYDRIEKEPLDGVWITLRSREEAVREAEELERKANTDEKRGTNFPLFGLPFAVKDNIDVAGLPTTSACPEFAHTPRASATVVERLRNAGAICIGKTNLDQFATGLVGVRSPYGVCKNPFHAGYIAGGSSSGSALAVAAGLVSFSLGTDTAGSGRVPAAHCNIVGLKPTRGRLSTSGVSPACRSLDCVSIFSLTVEDADAVLKIAEGFDATDPYSREVPNVSASASSAEFRFGIPEVPEFFGDDDAEALFEQAVKRLTSLGGKAVKIDFTPFHQTAELLYNGPWIAERWEALRDFHTYHAAAFHPVTRQIIERGAQFTAADLFRGLHELEAIKRRVQPVWKQIDVLLLPTAACIYTIREIEAEPVLLNTRLGYYTNFVNLLDLAAIAVPSGFRVSGLPFGVTFLAPAWSDAMLSAFAKKYHRAVGGKLGASPVPLAEIPFCQEKKSPRADAVHVAVVGAHLSGQPLNYQLTDLQAELVRTCRTAPCYRLYALPGTKPPKPGLIRASDSDGGRIEVEIWAMPARYFGSFVAAIPPPLGIGSILLEDGEIVKSFLCESYAVEGAEDITSLGGWRNFLAARSKKVAV